MRHAFDSSQRASLRIHTGDKVAQKQLASLGKSATASLPPLTSVTLDSYSVVDDSESSGVMLASILPQARFFACDDMQYCNVASDVSDCQPGDLVLYRIGDHDPNDLISESLARGASGILTEQLLPSPLPQCVVGCVDHALAQIASAQNQAPDRKLLTVGVLGDSGKTSTCLLAASLTKALGIRTAYQCDLASSDGVVSDASSKAVPVGADLIDWLGESSDCLSRVALVEIDERAARDGHYDAVQFDVLLVTRKSELADDYGPCGLQCLLERLTSTGIVVAPSDDTKTLRMLQRSGCDHISYGTTADSEFGAIIVDQSGGMSTLMLSAGDTSAMMETPLCGQGMASNIAATAALGALLGHAPGEIAKHLTSLRSIPGRGQRLVDFGKATVVIETGGTVDRVSNALRTAKETGAGGRVWCVLAIGADDCPDTLATYGQTIERFSHHCVVTSKPDQNGSFLKRTHQVLDGVRECAAIRLVADQEKAISWALETAGARDTVVVITNRRGQSAQAGRSELGKIESLVQSTRQSIDANVIAEEEQSEGTPVTLKLFP